MTAAAAIYTPTPVDLSTRAMLINLTIGSWSARKFDRKATQEVADAHHAPADVGRYTKKLIGPGSKLDAIHTKQSAARARHYELTLPWTNDGARILSSAAYFKYTAEMRSFQDSIADLVIDFAHEYPQLQEDARRRLNGLYNPADYPADIRDRFTFGFNVLPLPQCEDFRVQLGQHEVRRIQADMQAQVDASIQNAMRDVWQRMFAVVNRMSSALRAYQPAANGSKAENVFRDSLVENIREVLRIVPLLNITADAHVTDTAEQIERELCKLSADQLRCSKYDREKTADAADAICNFMADFIA